MNSTHSDSGYIDIHFAFETQEQPWVQGQTLQTGSVPCCSQQGSFGVDGLHLQKRWKGTCQHRAHLPRPPWLPMPVYSPCSTAFHGCFTTDMCLPTYTLPDLTLSTIPSSPRGEETLDQGSSSHRQAQIDEVFRRLPASPLMWALTGPAESWVP